jgi:hypothetical protein
MKILDKADDKFIQEAVDDKCRPWLIKETSRRRTMLFWCAVLVNVCAIAVIIFAMNDKFHNPAGAGVVGIMCAVAAMQWMQVLKNDSDLRLLKLVEKLKSSIH